MSDAPARADVCLLAALSLLLLVALPPTASASDGAEKTKAASGASATSVDGNYVGVGLGLFAENSRREGKLTKQVETTDESWDYNADDFLNGSLWFMHGLGSNIRVGGGLHYFGNYEAMRHKTKEERQSDEKVKIRAYELGQMVTPFARGEWLIPVFQKVRLVLGAEAGVSVLFPDGDFRQQLREMKDQKVSVPTTPRLGVDLAPIVGARWALDGRVAFRADFSVHWQRLYLMSLDQKVEGVTYKRNWTAKILRYNVGLTMEVAL